MTQDTMTFPERYSAVSVSCEATLDEVAKAMTYDIAAVKKNGRIVGTITRTQIDLMLRKNPDAAITPVEQCMEPYEALCAGPEDEDAALRDVFFIHVFALIRGQVEKRIYSDTVRDEAITTVFNHVRKKLNDGKFEANQNRMTFSQWVRVVSSNRSIDCLRKIPRPDAKENLRERQRSIHHATNVNPMLATNQVDVMGIIHKAIESLSPKQRSALLLNIEYPGLPGDDLSAKLGMSKAAFHINLNRARDKIQKTLKEYAPGTVYKVENLRNKRRGK